MNNLKEQIFDSLAFLATLYPNSKVTQETLEGYTEVLSTKLTHDELRKAFSVVTERSQFFPSIAEIMSAVRANDLDNAHDSVGRIFKAIQSIGSWRTLDAKAFLGDDWAIVESYGGWQLLCSINNSEIPIVRAQLREIAKSIHKRSGSSQEGNKLSRLDFSSLKLIDV